MLKPVRRLVTTRDENGRSKLLVEGPRNRRLGGGANDPTGALGDCG